MTTPMPITAAQSDLLWNSYDALDSEIESLEAAIDDEDFGEIEECALRLRNAHSLMRANLPMDEE